MTRHRVSFAAWLLCCLATAGSAFAQVQPAPAPQSAPVSAPAAQPAADDPIGNVATLTGNATVTRNNASTPLKLKDDIFLNDVLQTSANSTLGVTFNDSTTFNLTANARIAVDNFVYADGGKANAALFNVAKGTVAFVAAALAKSGDMKISTPTATLGIRGTTGLVEVPEGASCRRSQQRRGQALSRRGRQGRADRDQRPLGRPAGFPHPGRQRFHHPPRRRRPLCRRAAADLAAAGAARSGLCASGPRRAEFRTPDRHPAANSAPAKSAAAVPACRGRTDVRSSRVCRDSRACNPGRRRDPVSRACSSRAARDSRDNPDCSGNPARRDCSCPPGKSGPACRDGRLRRAAAKTAATAAIASS